jgi:hypothetical protein
MYYREWFAPVSLSAEEPVAEFVVDLCFTEILCFKPRYYPGYAGLFIEAVNINPCCGI